MKKGLSIIVPFIIIIGISFMSYRIFQKVKKNNEIALQIDHIPEFEFVNIKTGAIFKTQDLLKDRPVVFVYFNTECEHCKYEVSQISKSINQFERFQIILISIEEPDILLEFFNKQSLLTGSKNYVSVLYDKHLQFEKIFGNCPFPTSFIYNKDHDLVKVFKGEVKIEAILNYLKD